MEIKNTSKFKYEEMLKQMNTNPIRIIKGLKWLLIASALLLAALLIIYVNGSRKISNLIILIIKAVFFVGLFTAYVLYPKYYKKSLIKNSQIFINGVTYDFVFKDESFTIEAVLQGQTVTNEIAYSSLYMLKITEAIIYLYVNGTSYYMAKSDGFVKGERKQVLDRIKQYVKKVS